MKELLTKNIKPMLQVLCRCCLLPDIKLFAYNLMFLSRIEFHCKSDVIACQPTVASLVMKLRVKGWLYQTWFVNDSRGCDLWPSKPPIMKFLPVQHFSPVLSSPRRTLGPQKLFRINHWAGAAWVAYLPIWRRFYGDQEGKMHSDGQSGQNMHLEAELLMFLSFTHRTLR